MKLSHALWGHPRWEGMVERPDRMWSTGEGNDKPLQHSCLENPMNSMKVPNTLLEISGEITPERMKGWSQSKDSTQLWVGLMIEARFDAVESNIA